MSNYYKNVNGTGIALTSLIYCSTISLPLYSNINVTVNSGYSGFNSIYINEKPSNTNYSLSGTDIANNCIAMYVEYVGNTTQTITTQSWCNKIRAIIVGYGGTGTSGTNGVQQNNLFTQNAIFNVVQQQYNPSPDGGTGSDGHPVQNVQYNVQHQYQNILHFDVINAINQYNTNVNNNNTNPQQQVNITNQTQTANAYLHNIFLYYGAHGGSQTEESTQITYYLQQQQITQSGIGGGGGASGGFMYIQNCDVSQQKQILLNSQATLQTGTTTLTLCGSNYVVYNGGNGSSSSGGTTIANQAPANAKVQVGINTTGINGGNASGTTAGGGANSVISTGGYSSNLTIQNYGKGGEGGAGSASASGATAGSTGGSSYCRIYYLTG